MNKAAKKELQKLKSLTDNAEVMLRRQIQLS